MKSEEVLDIYFSEKRNERPDISRVEAGFETRLMARIRQERGRPAWHLWSWRLVPLFTAVVISLGAWYYSSVQAAPTDLRTAITADYYYSLTQNFLNGD